MTGRRRRGRGRGRGAAAAKRTQTLKQKRLEQKAKELSPPTLSPSPPAIAMDAWVWVTPPQSPNLQPIINPLQFYNASENDSLLDHFLLWTSLQDLTLVNSNNMGTGTSFSNASASATATSATANSPSGNDEPQSPKKGPLYWKGGRKVYGPSRKKGLGSDSDSDTKGMPTLIPISSIQNLESQRKRYGEPQAAARCPSVIYQGPPILRKYGLSALESESGDSCDLSDSYCTKLTSEDEGVPPELKKARSSDVVIAEMDQSLASAGLPSVSFRYMNPEDVEKWAIGIQEAEENLRRLMIYNRFREEQARQQTSSQAKSPLQKEPEPTENTYFKLSPSPKRNRIVPRSILDDWMRTKSRIETGLAQIGLQINEDPETSKRQGGRSYADFLVEINQPLVVDPLVVDSDQEAVVSYCDPSYEVGEEEDDSSFYKRWWKDTAVY